MIAALAVVMGQTTRGAGIAGFEDSPHFGEQVRTFVFEPDVRVHINAPGSDAFKNDRPVRLVVYALPNGNTIEQTVGRWMEPGLDWHFDIQHIGAQIRRLREVVTDATFVVAYVEAKGRSWPRWRKEHADSGKHILRLLESLRGTFAGHRVTVDLAAHSGGGSLIFGMINEVGEVPDWIGRIVLLDANYGYDDAAGHGDKVLAWLRADEQHRLCVIAYDDRRVRLDGKLVVGPEGGTWRATQRMIDRLQRDVELTRTETERYERLAGLGGRVELTRVKNPEDAILHTVLVEKNGLIHALTFGTPWEGKAGAFFGERAYSEWIQRD